MAVLILYLAYLLLPILLLLVGSFGEKWTNTLLPLGLTSRWFVQVLEDPSFRRAFTTSLGVTLAACAIVLVVSLPLAYSLLQGSSRLAGTIVRMISIMPIAAPPLVLGFGFILVFSSDEMPFLGTSWLLLMGHVVLTLPYMLHTLTEDMRHLDLKLLEQAADSLGASFSQSFFQIVIPSLRHSIRTGLTTVAAISIGEFQLSNLIAGFLNRTYPVVLLQSFYGATGFACAATVVLLLLSLLTAAPGSGTGLARSQLHRERR